MEIKTIYGIHYPDGGGGSNLKGYTTDESTAKLKIEQCKPAGHYSVHDALYVEGKFMVLSLECTMIPPASIYEIRQHAISKLTDSEIVALGIDLP